MASATAFPVPAGGGGGGARSSRPCAVSTPTTGPTPATASATATSPGRRSSASTSATISSANKSRSLAAGGPVGTGLRPGRIVRKKTQQLVQWKSRNVQEGIVIVDEAQLGKLIKRDPIEKFYDMDPEPFATGMFASVRRCRSRDTGLQLAAKFSSRLRYGADCSAEIHHEIALLSLCSPSPRVVKLHDVFQTDKEIILVMEYAPGGDLQTLIDDNIVPYESDVVSFTRQLVEGLAYLHHRKIAHLDIKPQNLVMMGDFPDCDVKLCDFEISRVILEGTEIREILGTPDYVAPEILHYEPITMAADMWSLGVTVYVLLTGFSPFGGETDQETFCNISRAQLDFPEELFEDVSPEAQDFVRRLLQRDPRSRPTAKECLRHPWLSQRSARSCASCSTLPSVATPGVTTTTPNLRKYLSKSREALFERVLQRGGVAGAGLLGAARAHQLAGLAGRARLCESQMSLVSKSREREAGEAAASLRAAMSPSLSRLSRSREKLYGLRSLSRSQEVLAMCRALPVLRTLTRATTADLSQLGVGGVGLLRRGLGSHTSVGSELDTLLDLEDEPEPLGPSSTPATPLPPPQSPPMSPSLERTISTPAESGASTAAPGAECTPEASSMGQTPTTEASPTPPVSTAPPEPSIPPEIPSATEASPTTKEPSTTKAPTAPPVSITPDSVAPLESPATPALLNDAAAPTERAPSRTLAAVEPAAEAVPLRPGGLDAKEQQQAEQQVQEAEAILSALRTGLLAHGGLGGGLSGGPALLAPLMVAAANGCAPLEREQSTLSSNSESSESTLEGDDDAQADEDFNEDHCEDAHDQDDENESENEQDEPRFTVAQLITAYNLHDEVVTKSSLDFTMAATDREAKLPPVLSNKSKFPTGPNALRLFIPDIDITNAKPRKSRKAGIDSLSNFVLHASKIVEEEPDCQSPDRVNNNLSDAKLMSYPSGPGSIKFMRSESLSSETSAASGGTGCSGGDRTGSVCSAGSSTTAASLEELAQPMPVAPPPPSYSTLEPKKSPKPNRNVASTISPSPSSSSSSTSSSSVQRHRRSASTPNSDSHAGGGIAPREPRIAGLSPSPSPSSSNTPSKAAGGRGAGTHNGVNRSGSGLSHGRKPTGNSAEKLRRKSTPVFK